MRACFVVSNSFALNAFLAGPIAMLAASGWQVTVVLNTRDGGAIATSITDVAQVRHVDMARDIALLADLRALGQLWRLMRAGCFDTVHSVTPKAGLLAMLAGWLARVPARMHTFTGQVWVTRTGAMRSLLKAMDRLLAACATRLLADSPSQRDFLASEGIASGPRVHVLGDGSICGVDTQRFRPDAQARESVRKQLGIPLAAPVVLYLGRLHPDKGLAELGAAFATLLREEPATHLVLAGPDEGGLALVRAATGSDAVHPVGLTREPERFMAAADIFCLPSYREGFGLSLLEAASAQVPAVATRIYGITDAVVDGETGLLVPARDSAALAAALRRMVQAPQERARMGAAARNRAVALFSRERLLQAWAALYADRT